MTSTGTHTYSKLLMAVLVACWLAAPIAPAAEPSLAELVGALKSPDEATRVTAADRLGARAYDASSAVLPLVKTLADPSPKVRAHAAHALGQIGKPAEKAVAPLAELVKDPDAVVRREALDAVLAIGAAPEITMPLVVKLLEESEPAIRVRILNTISETGAPAVPRLIGALKNDKAAYWACLVAQDMGLVAKEAVPALTQRIKDRRPQVRREAILALAAMDAAAKQSVPAIATALSDPDTSTAATFALGRIGEIPANAEAVVQRNAESKDAMLSTVSIWALAKTHPGDKQLRTKATEQLIARIDDEDPYVRIAAARGLVALPPAPEITLPIWNRVLADASESTVHHALDALASIGQPAVPQMVDALKFEKLRPEILEILRHLGPAAAPATDAVAALVGNEDEDVARAATMALAAIGPGAKSAVSALLAALGHPDNPNAHAIVYALGSIGKNAPEARPALAKLLQGSDEDLALISAWSLTKIAPSAETAAQVIPVLERGLAAPLAITRRGAAETLAGLGPLAKAAVPALERAAKDPDPSVREAASQALAAVRG
ncbi:MAG: HEAT repeat domain-containing protein [Pirellulales bacterium]